MPPDSDLRDMIARMTTPASKTAAGSVGTVDTQFLDLPKPLALDCGRELHPIRIAYETYGTLSPARDNVILVCHALSGDAHAAGFATTPVAESTRDGFRAEERDAGTRPRPRLVGRHDRPRQGLRHRPVLRRQHQPARRLPRHDRAVVHEPGDRPALRVRLSGHHRRRHGARASARSWTSSGSRGWPPSPAARSAACRRSSGPSCTGDQVDAIIPIASTHALQPQGVAWNAIARNAITADPDWQGGHYYGTGRAPDGGHGRGPHGRPHHVSLGHVARRQVRPAAAVRGRHPLHADGARVRGRELPAPPGGYVREALRRQHLSLHVAGAVLLRPRPAVRRRPARARAAQRVGQDAAHRVQLRLAVSAVGLRGARGGASRGRQGGRAPRDRRAVRTRLLPVGGGAPDAYDSGSSSRR